jgi:hypothetical protein
LCAALDASQAIAIRDAAHLVVRAMSARPVQTYSLRAGCGTLPWQAQKFWSCGLWQIPFILCCPKQRKGVESHQFVGATLLKTLHVLALVYGRGSLSDRSLYGFLPYRTSSGCYGDKEMTC